MAGLLPSGAPTLFASRPVMTGVVRLNHTQMGVQSWRSWANCWWPQPHAAFSRPVQLLRRPAEEAEPQELVRGVPLEQPRARLAALEQPELRPALSAASAVLQGEGWARPAPIPESAVHRLMIPEPQPVQPIHRGTLWV